MNSGRVFAAAAQLQDGRLLVTGGYNDYQPSSLNSAEMLTEKGWENNIPSLQVTIFSHCIVAVNSTTVMVIGGMQNQQLTGKTFFFTLGEQNWTEGPELNFMRQHHSCGRIRRDKDSQEMSIIVAGGYSCSSY